MAYGRRSTRSHRSNRRSRVVPRGQHVEASYSPEYLGDIWSGMLHGWEGKGKLPNGASAIVMRDRTAPSPQRLAKNKGFDLGVELAEFGRELIIEGEVIQWDTIGELIAGDISDLDRAANAAEEGFQAATGINMDGDGFDEDGDEGFLEEGREWLFDGN